MYLGLKMVYIYIYSIEVYYMKKTINYRKYIYNRFIQKYIYDNLIFK